MCNRVVQNDVIVKPGERAKVLMRGPGGEFEVPFDEAIFATKRIGEKEARELH